MFSIKNLQQNESWPWLVLFLCLLFLKVKKVFLKCQTETVTGGFEFQRSLKIAVFFFYPKMLNRKKFAQNYMSLSCPLFCIWYQGLLKKRLWEQRKNDSVETINKERTNESQELKKKEETEKGKWKMKKKERKKLNKRSRGGLEVE